MAQSAPVPVVPRIQRPIAEGNEQQVGNSKPAPQNAFQPTLSDVLVAQVMLVKAKKLPPDIVQSIFDFAEYWTHSTNEVDFGRNVSGQISIRGRMGSGSRAVEDKFVVSRRDCDSVCAS